MVVCYSAKDVSGALCKLRSSLSCHLCQLMFTKVCIASGLKGPLCKNINFPNYLFLVFFESTVKAFALLKTIFLSEV